VLQALLFVVGATLLFGSLGFGLLALFAADEAKAWARVRAATTDPATTRVRAVAVAGDGGPLRAPQGGASCCWYAVWAVASASQDVGADARPGGYVALFERSTAPVVIALDDGTRVELDPARTWFEPGPGQPSYQTPAGMPFGAAPAHRALAAWPATRSWAQFAARPPSSFGEPPAIGEVWLEPGARVDAYGVAARAPDGRPTLAPVPAAGGVVVLRADGAVARQALEQAARSARRRLVRVRAAMVLGAGFLVFFVVGGVLSG